MKSAICAIPKESNVTKRQRFSCIYLIALAWIHIHTAAIPAAGGPPVRVRINTTHGLESAIGAVQDVGLSVETDVIITPTSVFNGRPFLPPDKFILDALTSHANILSSSFSGWDYRFDSSLYRELSGKSLVHVYAYEPNSTQPPDAPPPAAFVTVNISEGKTGGGIEFSVPKGYMGRRGQSESPSGVTAQLAGLMASLKHNHPEWNWFDIKAALRMTASNFRTGYNPEKSGYGAIDFWSANTLTDAGQFPLFPPAALMRIAENNMVVFAINSFKQSRRTADALFRFRMRPFPVLRELTLAQLNSMGGQLLFTGDRSETTNLFSLQMNNTEMTYFIWLTKDRNGLYSRIEPYSILGPVFFPDKTQVR